MTIEIETDDQWLPLIHWHDLSESEQADVKDTYCDISDASESTFFRYDGMVWDLSDFVKFNGVWGMRVDESHEFYGWHANAPDSNFSGTLIHLSDCGEAVQVGKYIAKG